MRHILDTLEARHPETDTELRYSNAFELIVATILSAQSTDAWVNLVTSALFEHYPNVAVLEKATVADLELHIHSTGFFRTKAKVLFGMAHALVTDHGGAVPAVAALTKLPGVGRKTANPVLGHPLGAPGLPVDRHVLRVANRIGIAKSDEPEVVEQQLGVALPSKCWTRTSDTSAQDLLVRSTQIWYSSPVGGDAMASSSMDRRRRVLREWDVRMRAKDVAAKYSANRSWIHRLHQPRRATGSTAPRKQTRWRAPSPTAQLPQLQALVREQPDGTLPELQAALGASVSLTTRSRAIARTPTDHGQENPVRASEQSARTASWFGVSGSH